MKKLKVLLSVMTMSFVMVGCGGGGDSSVPVVDNSLLTDTENQYGYFGEEVIFGDTKIVGDWFLTQQSTKVIKYIDFSSDGESTYDSYNGDYGVSKDGKLITAQYQQPVDFLDGIIYFPIDVEIKYLSTSSDVSASTQLPDGTIKEVYCYNVELTDFRINGGGTYSDIIMCPFL